MLFHHRTLFPLSKALQPTHTRILEVETWVGRRDVSVFRLGCRSAGSLCACARPAERGRGLSQLMCEASQQRLQLPWLGIGGEDVPR